MMKWHGKPKPARIEAGQWWGTLVDYSFDGTDIMVGHVRRIHPDCVSIGDSTDTVPHGQVYLGCGERPSPSPGMVERLARVGGRVRPGPTRGAALDDRDPNERWLLREIAKDVACGEAERRAKGEASKLTTTELVMLETWRSLRSLGYA